MKYEIEKRLAVEYHTEPVAKKMPMAMPSWPVGHWMFACEA